MTVIVVVVNLFEISTKVRAGYRDAIMIIVIIIGTSCKIVKVCII